MKVNDHAAMAMAVLQRSAYPEVRSLSCRLHQERLVVAGRVPSFYLKQIAQTLLLDRFGNSVCVENRVAVSDCGAADRRTPIE